MVNSTTKPQIQEKDIRTPVRETQNLQEELEIISPEKSELIARDTMRNGKGTEQSSADVEISLVELEQSIDDLAQNLEKSECIEQSLVDFEQSSLWEESEPSFEEYEEELEVEFELSPRKMRKRHQSPIHHRNSRH